MQFDQLREVSYRFGEIHIGSTYAFEHEKLGPLGQVSPAGGGIAGKPPGK